MDLVSIDGARVVLDASQHRVCSIKHRSCHLRELTSCSIDFVGAAASPGRRWYCYSGYRVTLILGQLLYAGRVHEIGYMYKDTSDIWESDFWYSSYVARRDTQVHCKCVVPQLLVPLPV